MPIFGSDIQPYTFHFGALGFRTNQCVVTETISESVSCTPPPTITETISESVVVTST